MWRFMTTLTTLARTWRGRDATDGNQQWAGVCGSDEHTLSYTFQGVVLCILAEAVVTTRTWPRTSGAHAPAMWTWGQRYIGRLVGVLDADHLQSQQKLRLQLLSPSQTPLSLSLDAADVSDQTSSCNSMQH